jgi:hypothetical protein
LGVDLGHDKDNGTTVMEVDDGSQADYLSGGKSLVVSMYMIKKFQRISFSQFLFSHLLSPSSGK